MQLLRDLSRAFRAGELHLHFQPVVDCKLQRIHSIEALLRWQHPVLGPLQARQFSRALNMSPLVEMISSSVLQEALRAQARWVDALGCVPVSVNLPPHWIASKNFLEWLQRQLWLAASPTPARLFIEIVETEMIRPTQTLLANLGVAGQLGVAFLVDDFGTGYTSIGELRDLPLRGIKIDRRYVHALTQSHQDQSVLRGMLHLAEGFDLMAIAEGVESPAQVQILQRLGCRFMQGHGLFPPVPEQALHGVLPRGYEQRLGDILRLAQNEEA